MSRKRIEHDTMGKVTLPANALYGAQTQRAVENFPVSGLSMPPAFIRALLQIKFAAAKANVRLKQISARQSAAICASVMELLDNYPSQQFPVDVFQTGSGTSSNMNVNEVIAHLASKRLGKPVHPNDHVNCSQSSNDVVPSAIQLSALAELEQRLIPALKHIESIINVRRRSLTKVKKNGRTHLMDATPISLADELSAWSAQISSNIARLRDTSMRARQIPLGGTAIGTGINADPKFGPYAISELSKLSGVKLTQAKNLFEHIASQDVSVEIYGQLNTLACSLMKIANDLRWMNSGPVSGLSEIRLPALQPGSSIMPGKVNPVIAESVCMVCAQVMGNHQSITIAGQSGNFQLNTMMPLIAYNLLQSIELLSNAARLLADKAIAGFEVNRRALEQKLSRNPILVTALNPIIGYEKAAAIAKRAYAEQRPLIEVALEETGLCRAELKKLLQP